MDDNITTLLNLLVSVSGILSGSVRTVRARAQAQKARERQQHGVTIFRRRRQVFERDQLRQVQGEHRVHGDHAGGHLPR